jgi:hypothetical protein
VLLCELSLQVLLLLLLLSATFIDSLVSVRLVTLGNVPISGMNVVACTFLLPG